MEDQGKGIPRSRTPGRYPNKETEGQNWRAECSNPRQNFNANTNREDFRRHFSPVRFSNFNRRGTNFQNYLRNPGNGRGSDNFRNRQRTERSERCPIFGFSLLEKDAEQLILELSNSKTSLMELIQEGLKDDFIVLFVKLLRKIAESVFEEGKYYVLQTYLRLLHSQLSNYILHLMIQTKEEQKGNNSFWNDPDDFWNNIIKICQEVMDSLPTFALSILPSILKSLTVCFPTFEAQHGRHISDEIKEKVENMRIVLDEKMKAFEDLEKNKASKSYEEEEQEPPDDFRQISVYPNSYELLLESGNETFLRKNVIVGSYKSVDHYLDVQFRLLREDFVGPLRSGIQMYQSKDRMKKIENLRIYDKVLFLNHETINEQFCLRLQFDFSQKKTNFKFENSKRFMFGALLCFTANNFKTIIFGKVAARKTEDLRNGQVIVGFEKNVDVKLNTQYMMVEYGVYFEPYYHVLTALQHMGTKDFPMEKYIIRVDTSTSPPRYLRNLGLFGFLNSASYLSEMHYFNFNESQQDAFRAAMTQEFCILQGPPGTGKTYVGLKIARSLLENHEIWYNETPMLVICYTNHALDQFLEGISKFTEELIRVGGQSKNENLERFNIRNQRIFKRSPATYGMKNTITDMLCGIQTLQRHLMVINHYHSVSAFTVFEVVIPNFRNSWFSRATNHEILDWLLDLKEINGGGHHRASEQLAHDFSNFHIGEVERANDEIEEIDDENEFGQNDELDDVFDSIVIENSVPLITLEQMSKSLELMFVKLAELRRIQNPTLQQHLDEVKCTMEFEKMQSQHAFLKFKLDEAKRANKEHYDMPKTTDIENPYSMPFNDRWELYFHWLGAYRQYLLKQLERKNTKFREIYKIYENFRDIEQVNVMKTALVVGMTTTSAARLRSSLQALRSPIVIVEEAAEVLESHIVSALTKYCQHLILIGDHQQLKPSTANYNIERFYNLGISLFERMVLNKIQLHTLNVQHRMRPEISSLICPTIYPNLQDHASVMERPKILGVDSCLYFLDHTHPEEACENASKRNYHEAQFLINFARHLISNGYEGENITILAAYQGQMFEMQNERTKYEEVLKEVKVAVLDNYQGEESDIILLSLVRSNPDNKIGFLSIENRVCVALSRARNGFYIMGNMSQLCGVSELWQKIRASLQEQNALGTELTLRCQNHPENVTYVKAGDDFASISEGGCKEICDFGLPCGHKCTSLCHILDPDHLDYKCREKCLKELCDTDPLHLCQKMCFEECGKCTYPVSRTLECGHNLDVECHIDPKTYHCPILVTTTLPCAHVAAKPCGSDPITFRCPFPCDFKVEPCGHACESLCHVRFDPDHLEYKCRKPCARYRSGCTKEDDKHFCRKRCFEECEPCLEIVQKERSCGHFYQIECEKNVDEMLCEKPCKKVLLCGHKCHSKCMEICALCSIKVEKISPICGHTVKVKCHEEPNRSHCSKKCPLKLPCGHNCTKKCNELCTSKCKEVIDTNLELPCGHVATKMICHLANSTDLSELQNHCNHPCSTELKCGHTCSGTCGECYQGRIHKQCALKCGFTLVCGHPCDFPCRQACRPCNRKCPYKCKHSACSKRCGDVCTPCKEKCTRKCRHQECSNFCGDFCSVPPCDQKCNRPLKKCGHPCVGFCGDPCPNQCRICDKDELTEIFFGNEDEDGATFILLVDCGHIFESTGLDEWIHKTDQEIGFKVCPKCKTPIKTTQRYGDEIKRAMAEVAAVKLKFYGNTEEIEIKRNELLQKLLLIEDNVLLGPAAKSIKNRLVLTKRERRQQINKTELSALEAKIQILEHIDKNIKNSDPFFILKDDYKSQVNLILKILTRDEDYISDQEIYDINFELNRFGRILEFVRITHLKSCTSSDVKADAVSTQLETLLYSKGKFIDSDEVKARELLEDLNKMLNTGLTISESERRDLVTAMGFKQGHWYKCRNGHPYVIGECGGAMQESKCVCGAPIGGQSHSLLSDNRVATEMDGAKHGAWSDAANMGNYEF